MHDIKASKTYALTLHHRYEPDSAIVRTTHSTLTVNRHQDGSYSATKDGQPITVQAAYDLAHWADYDGSRVLISEFKASTLGTRRAHAMHKELVKAGYRSEHYALASGVLGKEVRHLRDLTEDEARKVWHALTGYAAA